VILHPQRLSQRRPYAAACWACLWLLISAAAASAGQIGVKGEVLEGSVVGVTSKGVLFETIYGEGKIMIPYADIESLHSDVRLVVIYGETGEVRGFLQGLRDGELLVGDDAASARAVPADEILRSFAEEEYEGAGLDALRSRYRFWRANFDFGFAMTQATSETGSVESGLEIERKKQPTRLLLTGTYRYATEKQRDTPTNTIENELRGLLRGEYDLAQHFFGYASATGEYDEVESLSMRSVSKAGVGVRIWESERGFLSGDVGFSYVYQRFFGGSTESYPAAALGTEAEYRLPYHARLAARGEYLPSVEAPRENYLLRGSVALSVPMASWLALKFSVFDEYNNRPAEDANKNKLTVTAGLSLLF
jgi:putative salt-induced outer membrane protein YdiY